MKTRDCTSDLCPFTTLITKQTATDWTILSHCVVICDQNSSLYNSINCCVISENRISVCIWFDKEKKDFCLFYFTLFFTTILLSVPKSKIKIVLIVQVFNFKQFRSTHSKCTAIKCVVPIVIHFDCIDDLWNPMSGFLWVENKNCVNNFTNAIKFMFIDSHLVSFVISMQIYNAN